MSNRLLFANSLAYIFIFCSISNLVLAQEVPGGFSSYDEIGLWLRAEDNILNNSDATAADGEEIKTWIGISNNSFSATKGTNGPLYVADGGADFNNYPLIEFDNTNRYLSVPDDDELDGGFSGISLFVVFKAGNSDTKSLFMKRDGYTSNQVYGLYYNNGFYNYAYFGNSNVATSDVLTSGNAYVSSFTFDGTQSSYSRMKISLNGNTATSGSTSYTTVQNHSNPLIIGKFEASDTRYLNGDQIAEILIIQSGLNSAQRLIIDNYYQAKYPGITLVNDYFTGNSSSYYYDLVGVGRFDGDEQTESASAGLVLSFYDGSLDTDGEFIMAAHDNTANSAVTTNLDAGIEERWSRSWYIEKTTAGTLNGIIAFDLGDGINGGYPQDKSSFVLLKYNSVSGNYEDVNIVDANKYVSGDRMVFKLTDAELADGIYTLGTTDKTNNPVIGGARKTWYSYQPGNWSDASTWTLDGAASPLYVNPDSDIPSDVDIVYITNGKTVTIQSTSNNLSADLVDVSGILDLTSSSGHTFTEISGDGIIKMEGSSGVDNFPSGDASEFADGENGGTIYLYGSGITLDQSREFNNVRIVLDNSTDVVTHLADYTVNGEFRIENGIWQINDNSSTTSLNISIYGDLNILEDAEINTGTADARHELNLYGDLDNDGGRVEFTNRTTADYYNEATDGIVDANFLADDADQLIYCKGVTNFYRIEINKGTDDTYILEIDAGNSSYFNLYGYASHYHGDTEQLTTNNNALGLIYGTVKINDNISIDALNVSSNYNISKGAKLWVDGGSVSKTIGTAIVPYGTILVSDGDLTADVNSGITTRRQGTLEVTGGTVDIRQFRTSTEGDINIGGYIQRGGTVNITGGSVSTEYAVFSLTYEENVFIMEGGNLNISGQPSLKSASSPSLETHGGTIFINSDPGNYSVTGGTVTVTSNYSREFIICSKAPFYDFVIDNSTTNTAAKVILSGTTSGDNDYTSSNPDWRTMTAQDLVILNDLTIETGTTRTSSTTLTSESNVSANINGTNYTITSGGTNVTQTWGAYLDLNGSNLTVGGDLTINDNAVLDVWYWDGTDNSGSSTITFDGSDDATFYIGDITTYTNALVEYKSSDTLDVTSFQSSTDQFQKWRLPLYNLSIDKDDATLFLASKDPGYGETFDTQEINQYRFIDGVDDNSIDTSEPAGKNISSYASTLLVIENQLDIESGTLSQVDPTSARTDTTDTYSYGLELNGALNLDGTLFEWADSITHKDGKVYFAGNNSTFDITNTSTSTIGNLSLRKQDATVNLSSDIYVERLEFKYGIFDISSNTLQVDVLDLNPGDSVGTGSNGEFLLDANNMIKMAGNQSDGGLSLKVAKTVYNGYSEFNTENEEYNNANWLWFPIGTGANSTTRYTPAVCYLIDNGTTDGDEYISLRVADKILQTTNLSSADDILSYFWNVDYEGYNSGEEATVSWIFQYDESDIDSGDETTYVPGKVLDEGTYERSTDADTIDPDDLRAGGNTDSTGNFLGDNPGNIILFNNSTPDAIEDVDATLDLKIFDGSSVNSGWSTAIPGTGFTLEKANYTAGGPDRFDGAPTIYYSRAENGTWWDWEDTDHWSTDTVYKHIGEIAGTVPGEGDIVVIGSEFVDVLTGGTYSKSGDGRHQVKITSTHGDVDVAEIIFDSQDGGSALYTNEMSRIRVRNGITLTASIISGKGELVQDVGPNAGNFGTITADVGDFVDDPDNGWFFWILAAGTTVVSDYSKYPVFRTFGGTNRNFQFGIDVEAEYGVVDNNTTLQIANNLTINNQLLVGSNDPGNVEFIEVGSNKTLETGSILFDDIGSNTLTVENSGSDTHTLKVNGDITFMGGTTFDLTSDAGSNVELELSTEGVHALYDSAGVIPDLYRIIMNKGEDTTSSFTFNSSFTLPSPDDISLQPVEIVNGLLILNDSLIDITLTSEATGDFYLPNTYNAEASSGSGGLVISNGTVNLEGDDTGIILDGLIRINGGTLSLNDSINNGNNFIEYTSSGNAEIEVSDGSLIVGSQLRRSLSTSNGVLTYTQTGGSAMFGKNAAPETTRGVFEVANGNSNFTLTGGDFTIVRQNGSNPSIAALYLQPDNYDVSGSTITIGNTYTPTGQDEIGINSSIAINNLVINGENEPTAMLYSNALTVDGNLTIVDSASSLGTLDADGLTLTINGDFINNGNYIPNGNTTIFSGDIDQSISGTGTLNFYNLTKTNSEILTLEKDITIENALDIDNGTFHTDTYAAYTEGNVTNDALHTSTSGYGIVFSGTSAQKMLRSSIGTSTFGIITINNTEGVSTPDGNGYFFTITDNLRLENGVLDIGNSLLTIDTYGEIEEVNTFSVTNMIQTNSSFTDYGVQKNFPAISSSTTFTFPVGESKYTPLTLDISSSSAGSITIRPADEIHPSILEDDESTLSEGADPNIVDEDNALQYHWILRASGLTGFSATATFLYDDEDIAVTSPYTVANYIPARLLSAGTTWDKAYSQADFDENNNEINFVLSNADDDGISGEYTAGVGVDDSDAVIYGAIPDEVPEYETDQSGGGDYDDSGSWSSSIPSSGPLGAIVTVKSGDVLTLNNSGVRLLKTIIEEGAVLEIDGTNNHRLGTVEGTGTIKIVSNTSSASLPAGYYGDFFSCSNGSLIYDGTGSYDVLGGINALENLTITGSGTRTMANNDINICNDWDISGSVVVNNINNRNINVENDLNISDSGELKTGSSSINLQGDITLSSNGKYTGSQGNVFTFDGSTDQNITGNFSGYANSEFYGLTLNNSVGKIYLNDGDTIEVDRTLTFSNGILEMGESGLIVLDTLGTYTGSSSSSFADGYFGVESLNTAFTFPVGDSASYNPISISSPTKGYWETMFRMQDPTTNAAIDNLDPDPDLLSSYPDFEIPGLEYYELTGPSPGSAIVEIGWNEYSEIEDYTKIFEMQWNSTDHWDAISNSPVGSNTSGTITSSGSVSFSTKFFTIGLGSVEILPVDLLSFTGSVVDEIIELNWQTSTEENTESFEVEKSINGTEFYSIGNVTAVGNSTTINSYSFDDTDPAGGSNYYRLKILDKDGNYEYSNVITVNFEVNGEHRILVHPNPVENHMVNLTLWGYKYEKEIHIKIIDMLGKIVFTSVIEDNTQQILQTELHLPDYLPTGIYQVIVNGSSTPKSQKILVK